MTLDSSTKSGQFAVDPTAAPQQPTITGMSPVQGDDGTVVTLSGSNFAHVTTVEMNSEPVRWCAKSDSLLLAVVPEGSTGGKFIVANGAGAASSPTFTVPEFTGFGSLEIADDTCDADVLTVWVSGVPQKGSMAARSWTMYVSATTGSIPLESGVVYSWTATSHKEVAAHNSATGDNLDPTAYSTAQIANYQRGNGVGIVGSSGGPPHTPTVS